MSSIASYRNRKITPVNGFLAENQLRDLQFKLVHNLQTTLDLHTTLEMFYHNIKDVVNFCGMVFQAPNSLKNIEFGQSGIHSASYNLKTEELSVGTIIFTRAKQFLEAELAIFEALSSVLFFPLRNALLYRDALQNSMRDALTGIGNRKALDIAFQRETKLAQRHYVPLSLAILDIDHFKSFNDEFGHQTGDKVLKHVANVVQATLRETDQMFRFGGEEFVVILNNTDKTSANLVAERVRLQCAMTALPLHEQEHHITVSIGVSTLSADENADTLFERADSAMYQAKKSGRNKVVFQAR